MKTNCDNCGAPLDRHTEKCAYCGTFHQSGGTFSEFDGTATGLSIMRAVNAPPNAKISNFVSVHEGLQSIFLQEKYQSVLRRAEHERKLREMPEWKKFLGGLISGAAGNGNGF